MQATTTKQSRYRSRLREQGLRPVQIWVPDTRRPGFAEECRRQSLVVSGAPGEAAWREWLEQSASFIEGWR
jgi:hypothetical protein